MNCMRAGKKNSVRFFYCHDVIDTCLHSTLAGFGRESLLERTISIWTAGRRESKRLQSSSFKKF